MKFLFASPHCLLDSSSGAAISMQTLLRELSRSGHRCLALGATIFGAHSAADKGPRPPEGHNAAQLLSVRAAEFEHLLVPTHNCGVS